jgi:hypothetical protein
MVKASLGVALAGERQPVPAGLVARPLAGAKPRAITLVAIAGRPQGAGVAAFLKLMRARNWRAVAAAQAKPSARVTSGRA